MRKFILRAAALLLAGVMTAAVTSCGKNSDSEAKDTAKKWTELDQTQITEAKNVAVTEVREIADLIAEAMGLGWNFGNQLEACSGGLPSETCWGNPEITKELIDTVKAQGFKTVRIPVSYLDMIGDGPDYKIDTDWLDRVQEVVDYVVNNDMFAIVNMHGDGYYTVDHSWLLCAEDDDKQTEIKDKYGKVWTQIADRFKDYDQHLIFESMNEEFNNDYGKPDEQAYDNINAYNQIFVDSVRATGSNNEKRWLLLPGWNTNIEYTAGDDYNFKIPTDKGCKADGKRIMISVHYYDPFNFTIDENKTAKTQWGKYAVKNYDNWGQEDYVDSQMALLNEKFVSQGYPVVIGEFGAQDKTEKFADYNEFRRYWSEYLIKAAKKNGVVCVYWDNGYNGNKGFGIINRFDYTITQPDLIAGMMRAINSTDDYEIPSPAGYTEVRKSAKAS